MTNRSPFQPASVAPTTLAALGLMAAGLRLRLSRELSVGLVFARTDGRNEASGKLLPLSFS